MVEIDYDFLSKRLKNPIKLSDVSDKIIRVAWDVVKFNNGVEDELWVVHKDDDNQEYLVARYDEEETTKTASTKPQSLWSSAPETSSVQVFYRNVPISKIAHEEPKLAASFLPKKLQDDASFRIAYLKSLPKDRQTTIKSIFPELF